jgi:hypothetical protein
LLRDERNKIATKIVFFLISETKCWFLQNDKCKTTIIVIFSMKMHAGMKRTVGEKYQISWVKRIHKIFPMDYHLMLIDSVGNLV